MTSQKSFTLIDESQRCGGRKIFRLLFDLPGEKVNKFSYAVMDEFTELLTELESRGKSGEIEAVILCSAKPGIFIAGADIEIIRSIQTADEGFILSQKGQDLLNRWEDLPFPTVVAIEGAAMGGGCELSLASNAIVMSSDPAARIGLPEVLLGVIPGMGGCVRLPRKVGLATALDMILTGKTLNGERAFKAGLADGFLPKEGFSESILKWVLTYLPKLKNDERMGKAPKLGGVGGPAGALLEKTLPGRLFILKKAKEGVLEKTRGQYPAPLEAIATLSENGAAIGPRLKGAQRARALQREAKGFGKLAATEISKNLIRIFFLTEAVKKSNGLPAGAGGMENAPAAVGRPVASPAVLGAGVMGGGVAQLFADKGYPTRMKDLNNQALALGVQAASQIFQKQVKKRKINSRECLQKINLISPTLDYQGFGSLDFVVEAVVENMGIKKKVFAELEKEISPSCVVVTNTSSLSVSEMQGAFQKPERFAGMHFFNPVHKMPLIEVIRGEKTSDETVSKVFEFSKKIGKIPVVVKDAPGFLVNRLLLPYLNEASFCVSEGVQISRIDKILLAFGMPMGPMELIDEVGIDVADKVAHILQQAFGVRAEASPLSARMLEAKRFGKKNSLGFYRYEGRKKFEDSAVTDILKTSGKPSALSDQDILERCIYPMINEAARCLDEAVVASSAELDLAMIMGTGFPPFRGGLLRYADSIGIKTVVQGLEKWEKKLGARFAPSDPLLKRGKNFYAD